MKKLCICDEKDCWMKTTAVVGAVIVITAIIVGATKHCKKKKGQKEMDSMTEDIEIGDAIEEPTE